MGVPPAHRRDAGDLGIHLRNDNKAVGVTLAALNALGVVVKRATVTPAAGESAVLRVDLDRSLRPEQVAPLAQRLLALKGVSRVDTKDLNLSDEVEAPDADAVGMVEYDTPELVGGLFLLLVLLAAIGSVQPVLRKREFVTRTLRPRSFFLPLALQKRYLQAGNQARAQGLTVKAARHYHRALLLGILVYGTEHPIVVLIMENYIAMLHAPSREAEAAALEARVRAIRAKLAAKERQG